MTIFKKTLKLSHKNGINAYYKSSITMICIALYMASYLYVQYKRDKSIIKFDEIKESLTDEDLHHYNEIKLFRMFEIWIFYSQVMSLLIYVF